MRAQDRMSNFNNGDLDSQILNSPAHTLFHQGKKAKRISHGTSHAESLANYTVCTHADMIGVRLTELFWPGRQPTLKELIDVESLSSMIGSTTSTI